MHPWVCEAAQLTLNAGADNWRQRVLRERGVLRGTDCVLMRHNVRALHQMAKPAQSAR